MIMVVILHYLDKGKILTSLSSAGRFTVTDMTAWLLEALCIVAVNLYMLMSGYLLCSSGFKLSRLLKLVAKVWLYSVIVGFVGIALGTPSETVDTYFMLRLLFPVSMNTYWFMTAYIFFYLLVPVLGIAARAMNRDQMKMVLVGLIFFHAVIKSLVPAQMTVDASGMDAMWYIVLFFVAVYIRRFTQLGNRCNVSAKEENASSKAENGLHNISSQSEDGLHNATQKRASEALTAVILYVIGVLLIFGEAMALRAVYLRSGSFSYILNISYSYNHVLVLIASVALFIAFLKMNISDRAGKVFAFLGKYSLGVYLLHENLSVRYYWETFFEFPNVSSASPIVVIARVLLVGIIIFVAGVIFDFAGSGIAGFVLRVLKKAPVTKLVAARIEKADNVFSSSVRR
ncbi:MAG: acyltransferase [Lachnospiraceae bacterium]|nr:acyltransferase [Lachnospiraceae bacterium]